MSAFAFCSSFRKSFPNPPRGLSKNYLSKNYLSKNYLSKNYLRPELSKNYLSKNYLSKNYLSKNYLSKSNPVFMQTRSWTLGNCAGGIGMLLVTCAVRDTNPVDSV